MIEISLPLPCSVNELYIVIRGRKILSPKARKWKMDALTLLKGNGELLGQVSVIYDFTFPDNRKRDISNYIKQAEDALVSAGIIKDDSLVMAFSATKKIEKGRRLVKIKIGEIKSEGK